MYNLFISHSWAYSDQYDRLVSLLNAAPNFDYRNYSVPKDDPIHNAPYQYQLKEAIRRQMQPVSCVSMRNSKNMRIGLTRWLGSSRSLI